MARKKWTGRLDDRLIALIKQRAESFTRSEGYIVETALGEMFHDELPPDWKPGQKGDYDDPKD